MMDALSSESLSRVASAIASNQRVSGLTHTFYRYPARFSPEFVRAMINEFTDPGDLVFDPFMGGGTTLVEAVASGRQALGTDISSLAAFVSQAKTLVYNELELDTVQTWISALVPRLSVRTNIEPVADWVRQDYHRNICDKGTWRIRKILEICVSALEQLENENAKVLARSILLKTGQWALDCRATVPSISEFHERLLHSTAEIIEAARSFAVQAALNIEVTPPKCIHQSVIGFEHDYFKYATKAPRLVVTSPPYPGLHVLYHRWQVQGRRETAAPFWLAGTLDGDGSSFYTFGDRKQRGLSTYFRNVVQSFQSVSAIADASTLVVQVVAFSKPELQLDRYLEAMQEAGFQEESTPLALRTENERVWRSVPSRKWYANQKGSTGGSKEVVLFHRKKR